MSRVFCDLATTRYSAPGHPEAPFRVAKTYDCLRAAGHRIEKPARAATPADVALLHDPKHLERLAAGEFWDADTPHFPGIADIAMISLSGALSAAQAAAQGEAAFSLMRPPGHHAGRERVSGFCYLNNVALACQSLLASNTASRLAILDVDVHHGDGTEELLRGKDGVLFCSLHQSPLYPGTGTASRGNCLNFPLPAGTEEKDYLKTLEAALARIRDFGPDVLAVSAGFDTYKDDPIAGLRLEKKSYARIAREASQVASKRFAVLEGGYAEELPRLVESFLNGFFG